MTTGTRVTLKDLARELAPRLAVGEEQARALLDQLCDTLKDCLSRGHTVEIGDLFSLSVAGGAELREDESGGFSAYAPSERGLAVHPLGTLKSELDRACHASIYYIAREAGQFKELLADHFGRRGWKLIHTRNGMEVFSRIDRHPPVALVFESNAEGWRELVREIKCDPRTNWVPVVGIFPEAAQDEPIGQLTVQPDEVVLEPFDFADFIRTAGSELAEKVTAVRHDLLELVVHLTGTQRDRRDACHMIEEVLFRARLPEQFCKEARGALFEALDNAVRHGHRNVECCTIELRLILDPRRLVMAVRDSGKGFDHAAALSAVRGRRVLVDEDPLARAAAALRSRRGDAGEGGIARMLQLADRVEFNKRGNEVVLTKNRPIQDAETDTNPGVDDDETS